MGNVALVIRLSSVTQADLPTLRNQFTTFLQTTLPQALAAANPATTVQIAVDKQSQYAETF